MPLFTVVMDYKGGTYIGQSRGRDPLKALENWAANLRVSDVSGFTISGKRDLFRAVRGDGLEPVEGVENVWCSSGIVGGQLALIHIIQTQQANET